MPNRLCLDCNTPTRTGSRCPTHQAAHRKVRRADQTAAARLVAAIGHCQCQGCPRHPGTRCPATTDLTADHITPLAQGGSNHGPRRVLCRSCNSTKRHT